MLAGVSTRANLYLQMHNMSIASQQPPTHRIPYMMYTVLQPKPRKATDAPACCQLLICSVPISPIPLPALPIKVHAACGMQTCFIRTHCQQQLSHCCALLQARVLFCNVWRLRKELRTTEARATDQQIVAGNRHLPLWFAVLELVACD
jgi:hypothetical protein